MPNKWETEPDSKYFESSGFRCLMRRSDLGIWCGYVAVPKSHPWYGKHYDDIDPWPSVHGGLTFSGPFHDEALHKQAMDAIWADGADWYLGFDCGHYMDYMPGMEKYSIRVGNPEDYRDEDYVTAECCRLAAQARNAYVVDE